MRMTDMVKHLLIINIIFFIGSYAVPQAKELLTMYYFESDKFRFWQPISSMFMHGGIGHIFFNMFALVTFGSTLEQFWGSKKFLFFYISCGLGAALLHNLFTYYELHTILADISSMNISSADLHEMMNKNMSDGAYYKSELLIPQIQDLLEKYKEPCPEALVESADRNIKILEDLDFFNFKISVKASDIFLAVNAYRQLSKKCDYPLHLGITEAGSYFAGTIKSSIGIGMLLSEGIGDTIRISLSSDPVNEVKAGLEILKSLNLKNRGVKIISCPSCARQAFEVIKTVEILEQRLSHIKEPLTLSIIGCVVNGPGEASQTDIGLTGGGKGNNMIYLSGLQDHKVPSEKIIEHIVGLVEKKAEQIRNQAL